MTTNLKNEKGPASVGALPDPGSNKPYEGIEMNMHDTITDKPAAAILAMSIDSDRMADECDADAQMALFNAFSMAADVLNNFTNQPLCMSETGDGYNQAGEILIELVEYFDKLKTRLIEDAKARPCADPRDNIKRMFMILANEVAYMDEMEKVASMASHFVYEQTGLVRSKRREEQRAEV